MAIEPYVIVILIAGILTICIPFFILKIRNQVVDMNRKLSRVVELLELQAPEAETAAPRVENVSVEAHPDIVNPPHPTAHQKKVGNIIVFTTVGAIMLLAIVLGLIEVFSRG